MYVCMYVCLCYRHVYSVSLHGRHHQNEQVLKKALASAVETARGVDARAPNAYQQAIDDLSASISEYVGAGLLLETTETVMTARKLLARMQNIASMRHVLRQAISTAERTRESGPLADCLDKLINADDLLRDPCADLIKDSENLLEDIREKTVREGACAYSHRRKNSPDMCIFAFTDRH